MLILSTGLQVTAPRRDGSCVVRLVDGRHYGSAAGNCAVKRQSDPVTLLHLSKAMRRPSTTHADMKSIPRRACFLVYASLSVPSEKLSLNSQPLSLG